jgi:hypothetical protein
MLQTVRIERLKNHLGASGRSSIPDPATLSQFPDQLFLYAREPMRLFRFDTDSHPSRRPFRNAQNVIEAQDAKAVECFSAALGKSLIEPRTRVQLLELGEGERVNAMCDTIGKDLGHVRSAFKRIVV